MKLTKRIIAMVLCLLMISSGTVNVLATENPDIVIVENTACTSCGVEDGHAEGCPVVTPCATCGQLSCFVSHENWCATCNTENCGLTHEKCDKCLTTDCKNPHEQWCEHCRQDNCGKTHVVCDECSTVDGHLDACTKNAPAESTKCDLCSIENGHAEGCPAVTPCVSCGELNCFKEHVICTECEGVDSHKDTCSQYVNPNACTECGEVEGHTKECSHYEPTVAEQLLEAESVEDLYMMILNLMQNDPNALWNLTAEELDSLRAHVDALDPEGDDVDTADLLDTLDYIEGELNLTGDPGVLADWNGTSNSGTYTIPAAGRNMTETVTIGDGKTLTLNGPGTITRGLNGVMFKIQAGGKLVLNNVVIEGNNRKATEPAIWVDGGTLSMDGSTIQNCYNNSANGTIPSRGGAIRFGSESAARTVTANINNSTIQKCHAANGSAIMFANDCKGKVTLSNSTITECYNEKKDYGGTIRTQGSANCELVIQSCIIKNNSSDNNGGGVYWNARGASAVLTISGTLDKPTIISGNKGEYGGGIFLSGKSITIENTEIFDNEGTQGGGIIMQPYDYSGSSSGTGCTLTLGTGTKVVDNTATEYGGGIYMQIDSGSTTDHEDFKIIINEGATIQGNSAKYGGGIAITQKTGNASYTGGSTRKYDTYLTINGGTIDGNIGTVNGGAFYISREYGDGGSGYDLKVDIKGGTIQNNKTDGNGGAIYLTDNAKNSKAQVNINGGTVKGNNAVANGGAVYVNNGSVNMTSGTVGANGEPNKAVNGGAVYVSGGNFTMSNGTMAYNQATSNGGAVYVSGGIFTMGGGVMQKNTATASGGAAYINNGDFIMNNGTLGGENLGNNAVNGGAVYVNGGKFEMSNGNATYNSATNGGAVYVANGNMTIFHGIVNNNSATNGGAVYMAGSVTTNLTMQSGEMSNNKASEDGGAIYSTSGNVYIGLQNCPGGDDQTMHGEGHHHPKIQNNEAGDTGGGICILKQGKVYFYCGEATGNKALYKGVGKNVFMQGGEFHLYKGANVGLKRDPDLVIIGGKLVNEDRREEDIHIRYYPDNINSSAEPAEGIGTKHEMMNLPDGVYFFNAPEGKRFVGWTAKGFESMDKVVRNKETYIASGDPVEIVDEQYDSEGKDQGIFDGTADKTIHLYALWAPIENDITYVDGLTNEVIPDHQESSYTNDPNGDAVSIDAAQKPGYQLKGWYIYQDLNQNANWGYEPVYRNGGTGYADLDLEALKENNQYISANEDQTASLTVPELTFGNITLVADYEELTVEIKYELVFIDGCDGGAKLSLYSEEILRKNGTAQGSTPTVEPGYKFVGWFTDKSCTTPVESNWVDNTTNKLTPEKEGEHSLYEARTYYARIEWDYVDVVIKVQEGEKPFPTSHTPVTVVFTGTRADNKETITLNVAFGSGDTQVIVKSVPVGSYKAYAKDHWAWRYDAAATGNQDIKDADQRTFVVNYTDNDNDLWLNGYGHAKK